MQRICLRLRRTSLRSSFQHDLFSMAWKKPPRSGTPSEKQHLTYLCLPWPELWAVSTATPTAEGSPVLLCLRLYSIICSSFLALHLHFLHSYTGTCATALLEKVCKPNNCLFFLVFSRLLSDINRVVSLPKSGTHSTFLPRWRPLWTSARHLRHVDRCCRAIG